MAVRDTCAVFKGAIPNLMRETVVTSALHHAVLSRNPEVVRALAEGNPDQQPHRALTQDGTALHLAAWTGDAVMVQTLLELGADVNASSSDYDIRFDAKATKVRDAALTTVARVPWAYQQQFREFTPLDIFSRYCSFKGDGRGYAKMSETRLLLEGHGGNRHGEDYLMHVLVHLTPDGGQMAVDAEEGAQARARSICE